MAKNLGEAWRSIVLSESNPSLQPENKRKGGGNEKQIIEMLPEKRPFTCRCYKPAIGAIEPTSRQAQWIKRVTK